MARASPLILVVDEDARSARTLASMLREDGFAVDVAVDGASAIARLTKTRPSVLVTDLRLSNADGFAVSHFARSRNADIHIIMVTGYPQLAMRKLAPEPIVLTKPLDYADLSAALERIGVRSC
jgi:CheY-like chemotaxis protein